MKNGTIAVLLMLAVSLAVLGSGFIEAPTGFDGLTNGSVTQPVMDKARDQFAEVEAAVPNGLGPLYNAVSCLDCHQSIADGGPSQVRELRAGHLDVRGNFVAATIKLNDGSTVGPRSLINLRAICPDAIGQLSPQDDIRALRLSLPLFGDAFVEAVADNDLLKIAKQQHDSTRGEIHGQAIYVDILEGTGGKRIGRFGWKDQHASLLSFSSDAYLNEMGVTNNFNPTEVTLTCNPPGIAEPNNTDDIFNFATFMRALKAPPKDNNLARSLDAQLGADLFEQIGCQTCHVSTLHTVPVGTKLNGGAYTVSDAIGDKVFHPYGDFLLHDLSTGDGILQSGPPNTRNKMRTMPLWGVRTRVEFLHDGRARDLYEAIRHHRGEADEVRERFERLPNDQRARIIAFLKSL
ncbi:MAG TPA: di-heme oxidoredictase family protein [Candidatus Dormibacteraeota bacterium]|nr:di-heme oxidoredictase family protein [Candidatus Dormibacteraeota bacterium]